VEVSCACASLVFGAFSLGREQLVLFACEVRNVFVVQLRTEDVNGHDGMRARCRGCFKCRFGGGMPVR
jgi:hypothetical protein